MGRVEQRRMKVEESEEGNGEEKEMKRECVYVRLKTKANLQKA
jgi:hypothetical protein